MQHVKMLKIRRMPSFWRQIAMAGGGGTISALLAPEPAEADTMIRAATPSCTGTHFRAGAYAEFSLALVVRILCIRSLLVVTGVFLEKNVFSGGLAPNP